MKTRIDVLGSGREQVRAGPWRADRGVAFLAPTPDGPPLSPWFLAECLAQLAGRGFTSVVTAALPPSHRETFFAAGFTEHDRLVLLTHDFTALPPPSSVPTRRARAARSERGRQARKSDHRRVLAIDGATFADFWRLDEPGLHQAIAATRSTRFRVVDGPSGEPAGYALTGLDRGEGYMQRLAVAPEHHRRGFGRALALDGLHWLRRKRATRVLVNTQAGNDAAFSLYQSVGFRLEAADLVVLRRDLLR